MKVKLLKIMNEMRGNLIPIAIMSIMLFMNACLTVMALEEMPKVTEDVPVSVNVYSNQLYADAVMDNAGVGVINSAKLYDPQEIHNQAIEHQAAKQRLEEKQKAEEEARLAEERRIVEEKRKAEEAELKRVNQIKSIKLSKDITVSSNLTIDQIRYMLQDTGLVGTEWAYYNIQQKYGLNLFIATAISINEAGWKTNSYKARYNNNIYGITTGKQSFKSKQECIYHFADFMQRLYINQGLTTIVEIQPKYCPPYSLWDDDVWSIAKKLHNKVISKYKI